MTLRKPGINTDGFRPAGCYKLVRSFITGKSLISLVAYAWARDYDSFVVVHLPSTCNISVNGRYFITYLRSTYRRGQ